jgi:DNA-directed RNA polymerase II subunit RPB1
MLNSVNLCGAKDIKRVFLMEHDKVTISQEGNIEIRKEKEWVSETDGVNLKTVMCIDGVDFKRTYLNSCIEIFDILGNSWYRGGSRGDNEGVTPCYRV